jgi:predicted nucleic acid-binding protein
MGVLIAALAGSRVYLDTNVLIYAIEGLDPFAGELRSLLEAIDNGALEAVTSELTLAEALAKPLQDGNEEHQRAYLEALTGGSLILEPITRAILLDAARCRAENRVLRLPDAIHIATATASNCSDFLTNDLRLKYENGPRILLLTEICGG